MQLLKLKKLTDDTIDSLLNAIDSDQSGTIEYEEFVSALLNRMQLLVNRQKQMPIKGVRKKIKRGVN